MKRIWQRVCWDEIAPNEQWQPSTYFTKTSSTDEERDDWTVFIIKRDDGWYIDRFEDASILEEEFVEHVAGPFPTLKIAKTAWVLIYGT